MVSTTFLAAALFALTLAPLVGAPAQADTLNSALRSAYKYNPELDAERANLRATDETVPQAMSDYRPLVTAGADVAYRKTRNATVGLLNGKDYPGSYGIQLNQQIFRGFRTSNAVNEAEANVRAGREVLRNTEQVVLLSAVSAYMDVLRDAAIVTLRENNVRVLSRELKATQDRFSVGEVTKTDVAQSRARRAGAVSDLDLAQGNLRSSRAIYQRIVGRVPRRLTPPPLPTRLLPKSLKEARVLAERENPIVVGALYSEQAARYAVSEVTGELLPTLNLDATYDRIHTGGGDFPRLKRDEGIVGATLAVPLYQRGLVSSRIRQAKHLHVRSIQQVEQQRTLAREQAVTAWAGLTTFRAQLRSDTAQVEANQIALSGVREEEKVGQRTVLNVLDAEQELLDAQVELVATKRDLIVAAYTVIQSVGRLTAQDLGLLSTIYDAEQNYFNVRRKWFGISITHRDGREERVDVPDRAAYDRKSLK